MSDDEQDELPTATTIEDKKQYDRILLLSTTLQEVTTKVQSSLLQNIRFHNTNDEFQPNHGLDFLDAKNSLLLSYLIDLTYYIRQQIIGGDGSSCSSSIEDSDTVITSSSSNNCFNRLMEMKTAIDKMRGLDKKLRYQVDKLLAAAASITSGNHLNNNNFASAGADPLQFRPNFDNVENDDDDQSDNSQDDDDDNDDDQDEEAIKSDDDNEDDSQRNDSDKEEQDEEEEDDDIAFARKTVAMAQLKQKKKSKGRKANDDDQDNEDDDDITDYANDGIYRAPRLQAMPYTDDKVDQNAIREKRIRNNMRTSEIAQTITQQYGDAPEVDDIHGGTTNEAGGGIQRSTVRRIKEKHDEKMKFEESNMIRFTTTRLEKKERKQLMRTDNSNLNAITDIANLVKESSYARKHTDSNNNHRQLKQQRHDNKNNMKYDKTERHSNGMRKRTITDRDGRALEDSKKSSKYHRDKSSIKATNSLQATAFGMSSSGKNKKKRRS